MKFILLALMCIAPNAVADEIKRVGGSFLVKEVRQSDSRDYFVITFESTTKTGKFDVLKLESDHVHFAVRQGDIIRLSAEITAIKENEAEISQVLLFLPHVQGYTPVWLLSRKSSADDLKGSRYLEMHAPQSDFRIF